MRTLIRIKSVQALNDFMVSLVFTDGTQKTIDLQPFLRGPVFDSIRNDPQVFRSVTVDPRMGTVVWPNGADIDPDVLYHGLQPAWAEVQPQVLSGASNGK